MSASGPATRPDEPGGPTVMGLLAGRAGMTEGQLYSAVIAVVVAILLTVTGVPTAHQRPEQDGLSGPLVTLAPTTTTTTTAPPTTSAEEAP